MLLWFSGFKGLSSWLQFLLHISCQAGIDNDIINQYTVLKTS